MHQKQLGELNTRLHQAEANERYLTDKINKLQAELSTEKTKRTEEELKLIDAKEEIEELSITISNLRAAEVFYTKSIY